MIAIIPAVMVTTFVLQMTLLTEDPSLSDPVSAILAENMARYHNGVYQQVIEQQRAGALNAGLVDYRLTYPFKIMAGWTSEVVSDAEGTWLVTWPADSGGWSVADLNGVIEIYDEQNYRGGKTGEYTPSVAQSWNLPPMMGVIPANVPVIATELSPL